MRRALVISHNLIGDTLAAGVAIREFFKQKATFESPETGSFDVIDLLTQSDHVTRLYRGLGVEWSNIWTDKGSLGYIVNEKRNEGYNKVYTLGAGDAGAYIDTLPEPKPHIIEGFAYQLEIEIPKPEMVNTPYGNFRAWKPFYDPWVTLKERPEDWNTFERYGKYIFFSPFSASCSSRKGGPPNKMLKPEHWISILEFLRILGPIRMLGAPDDRPDERWNLSEEEVMTGVPLDWLAAVMHKAKLVVTIDNGIGHLADSQDTNHILVYPMCLSLSFIVNWGCQNLVPIQVEPNEIELPKLMSTIKRSAKHLMKG